MKPRVVTRHRARKGAYWFSSVRWRRKASMLAAAARKASSPSVTASASRRVCKRPAMNGAVRVLYALSRQRSLHPRTRVRGSAAQCSSHHRRRCRGSCGVAWAVRARVQCVGYVICAEMKQCRCHSAGVCVVMPSEKLAARLQVVATARGHMHRRRGVRATGISACPAVLSGMMSCAAFASRV